MKLIHFLFVAIALSSCASTKNLNTGIEGEYEVSCGLCNFDMTGEECELAIVIDDKKYYVEGTTIDEHGDAHAEDGFCSTVRKASVKGEIKHGIFVSESFELLSK